MSFAVTFTEIEQTISKFQQISTNVKQDLMDLDRAIAPLKSDWIGSAQQTYITKQQEWNAEAEAMPAGLEVAKRKLTAILENYIAGESQATRTWAY